MAILKGVLKTLLYLLPWACIASVFEVWQIIKGAW